MRYLLQLLIPALIVVAVVYVLTRERRQRTTQRERPAEASDTGPFIVILVISGLVALGTGYVVMAFLN